MVGSNITKGIFMNAENFAYWLKGFFELTNTTTLNENQIKMIKEHLNLVFNKVTAPLEPENTKSEELVSDEVRKIMEQIRKDSEKYRLGRAQGLVYCSSEAKFC